MLYQTLEQEVNNPKHYTSHESGIEAITITRYLPNDLGNAWKYGMRYEDKQVPKKDLKKLLWYLTDFYDNFVDEHNNISVDLSIPSSIMDRMEKVIEHEPVECMKHFFMFVYSMIEFNMIVNINDYLKVKEEILNYSETFSD